MEGADTQDKKPIFLNKIIFDDIKITISSFNIELSQKQQLMINFFASLWPHQIVFFRNLNLALRRHS